jgi:hypothetical protein
MTLFWMVAGSVGSWALAALLNPAVAREVFFGMLGPLLAVAGTWILVDRASRVNPGGMTAVMMAGFAVKMVFFALYVVLVMTASTVEATPFILSFTVYFVGLYAAEALLLRRVFSRITT